jgi:hypothetical protein
MDRRTFLGTLTTGLLVLPLAASSPWQSRLL